MRFDQLQLAEPILRAVAHQGYTTPTPIQAQAIPHALAGSDVLGCAQTGTGKTAAFALPMLHRLSEDQFGGKRPILPRGLILCPTRELAVQIAADFDNYGAKLKLRTATIYGGVSQRPQVANLRRGVDILIATPGRLMDLMNQGYVDLKNISMLVLDEADRMLDMGFIVDIRKIVSFIPTQRQTLFFSATMAGEIRKLAAALLRDPVNVKIEAATPTVDKVQQTVYFVERKDKPDRLAELMEELGMHRVIIFTRTKHGADRLVKQLHARGIGSEAIHGNKSQNARQRTLDRFRADRIGVLIATDIAARGLDVDNVSHVVNYDLTHEPETYVHRIGRTARAGQDGVAISLCDAEEVGYLREIERLIDQAIPVTGETPAFATRNTGRPARSQNRQGGGGGGRSRYGNKNSNGGGGGFGGRKPRFANAKSGGPTRGKRQQRRGSGTRPAKSQA